MPAKKKKLKQKKKRNIIVKKYITIKKIVRNNENNQPNQVTLPQSWNTTNSIESRITNALRDELINTNNQFKTAYERQKEFNVKINDNIGDIENHRNWVDEEQKEENKQIKNQLTTIQKRISKYAGETPEQKKERIREYNRTRYLTKTSNAKAIKISKENALTQSNDKEQQPNTLLEPNIIYEEKQQFIPSEETLIDSNMISSDVKQTKQKLKKDKSQKKIVANVMDDMINRTVVSDLKNKSDDLNRTKRMLMRDQAKIENTMYGDKHKNALVKGVMEDMIHRTILTADLKNKPRDINIVTNPNDKIESSASSPFI